MAGRKRHYIFAPEKPHRFRAFLLGVLVLLALAAAGLFIYNFGLNHRVTSERVYVTVPGLSDDLENWSILHLSDLHGKYIGRGHAAVSRVISGHSYSCVVFSGDMVGPDGDVQPLLDLVSLLPPSTPKLYLPGDSDPPLISFTAHASLSPYADWALRLQDAGVTILDRPVSFTRNKATIWFIPESVYSLDIAGTAAAYRSRLDVLNASLAPLSADEAAFARAAEYYVTLMEQLQELRKTIKASDVQIAVTHTPLDSAYITDLTSQRDGEDMLNLRRVSLVLAGHYAGGQWRLPGLGAIWVPGLGRFPEDSLIRGFSYVVGIPQYISPGLAASDFYPLPGRLFNGPVATTIYLTSSIR